MLGVKYSGKVIYFFDKLSMKVRVEKNNMLYRLAGYVRTTARRTIRERPGPSTPGKPPHAHMREGLRNIQFAVNGDQAVIGPVKFPWSNWFNEPTPHIHEFGGTYFSRTAIADYPQRPYMSVALQKLRDRGIIPRQISATIATVR